MKKRFLSLVLIAVLSTVVYADMPGNKPRPGSFLHLRNVDSLTPYTLMINDYNNLFISVTADTSYTILGGYGAPRPAMLFAINKDKSTDTLYFDAEGNQIELKFSRVLDGRLQYSRTVVALDETKDTTANNGAIDTTNGNSNLSNTNKWLIGISLAALAALIAWFVIKKKKNNKVSIEPGHGNV